MCCADIEHDTELSGISLNCTTFYKNTTVYDEGVRRSILYWTPSIPTGKDSSSLLGRRING